MKPSPNGRSDQRKLTESVDRQTERIKRAEKERPTLLASTRFIGTVGVLLVLPIVAGAYLGRWLDAKLAGYQVHWTMSLILLGVFVGAINVYYFVRE